jgi:plastocyanin
MFLRATICVSVLLFLASCGSPARGLAVAPVPEPDKKAEAALPPSVSKPPADDKSKVPEVSAANTVTIDNFTFSPKSLTVPVGATVKWINRDDIPHTVKSTAKKFASGTLDTDDSYTFTFTEPGTYRYFCTIHAHMTGEIVVK